MKFNFIEKVEPSKPEEYRKIHSGELSIGDVFLYVGNLFMRVDTIITHYDDGTKISYVNSIRLGNGRSCWIDGDAEVGLFTGTADINKNDFVYEISVNKTLDDYRKY